MELQFTKLHGLGNDFIFIDNLDGSIKLSTQQVRLLCDRHFGIGADGVILVEKSPREECAAYMHYINSDGTLAQMCGNGVRCFGKWLVDNDVVKGSDKEFVADTLAGPRPIKFETDSNGKLKLATVDMGEPILDPNLVPINAKANDKSSQGIDFVGNYPIDSPWGAFNFTAVSMGNPHAVCFFDRFDGVSDELFADSNEKSLRTLRVDLIGSFYESNPIFPEKSNIEFAVVTPEGISMRVYERGCAETYACGTGACATSVAASLTHRAERENTIHLLGGDLRINWAEDNHVYMTGPAEESFCGSTFID